MSEAPYSGPTLSQAAAWLLLATAAFMSLALSPLLADAAARPMVLSVGTFGLIIVCAVYVLKASAAQSPVLTITTAIVVGYWIFAFPGAINSNDDNGAYLIFSEAFYDRFEDTIQPLSERRLFSVGGLYAFQAPVMHFFGPRGLSLIEPAFGLLLFAAILFSNRNRSVLALTAIIGLLALTPAAGSRGLANTSSAFVLGAMSFALILVTLRIFATGRPRTVDVAIVVAIPLAAMLLRPTTAPFNCMVALIAALAIVFVGGRRDIVRLGLLAALSLAAFAAALLPYHEIGQTYLYPLFGRGTHLTAEGYSISGSIDPSTHVANMIRLAQDPLFLGSLLAALVSCVVSRGKTRLAYSTIVVVYVLFTAIVVYATGGLSSMRYVFPVALAIALTSALLIAEALDPWIASVEARTTALRWMALVGIIGGLAAIRVLGDGVVAQRLVQYQPNSADLADINAIAEAVNAATEKGDAVLLAGVGQGRFLVPLIEADVQIMDQPGVLSPWPEDKAYADGLNQYLKQNGVTAIVARLGDCSGVQPDPVGWSGMMAMADYRNRSALCALTADRTKIGSFDILTFPSG